LCAFAEGTAVCGAVRFGVEAEGLELISSSGFCLYKRPTSS
jgi:hypothetical protein